MAVEEKPIPIDDNNSSSDLLRKIVAAIVGIIIIIAIVLLAKWLGDLIKAKFIDKKTAVVQTVPPDNSATTANNGSDTTTNTAPYKISTYSASPSTGPNDGAYIMLGLMAVTGMGILAFSKKLSI